MKVLLDENLPQALRAQLPGRDVTESLEGC
jgi:hypothetical protein